jgi:hypothetical protein
MLDKMFSSVTAPVLSGKALMLGTRAAFMAMTTAMALTTAGRGEAPTASAMSMPMASPTARSAAMITSVTAAMTAALAAAPMTAATAAARAALCRCQASRADQKHRRAGKKDQLAHLETSMSFGSNVGRYGVVPINANGTLRPQSSKAWPGT